MKMDFTDEKLKLSLCEDSLKGLAALVWRFRSGSLEQKYWNQSPEDLQADMSLICQAIISCLNGVCDDIAEIGDSIDYKEIAAGTHKKLHAV